MNHIKRDILEQFEDVKFLPGKDKLLIGYAEMFGNDCIPLYKGLNYIPCTSASEAIEKIQYVNKKARTADGFDKCLIGHLKLDSGDIVLLYDKEAVIDQMKSEFLKDKSLYENEEDAEIGALEFYDFNILGAYMDGIPAFALLYSR